MGWFLVFIVIPILMPMALVGLYWLVPVERQIGVALVQQVKDGQLSWPACGFCASALYELANASPWLEHPFADWSQGGLIFLLVASSFVALLSVAFPTPMSDPPTPWGVRPLKMLVASFTLVLIAALSYTWLHFEIHF